MRRALFVPMLLSLLTTMGFAEEGHKPHGKHDATVRHGFEDVEHWVKVFDDPERDEWQRPAELVESLSLTPGDCVADIGAGTGYFEPYLAAAVGSRGAVLAVDVEPGLIVHLRKRADQAGLANVIPVLGSYDNPRLPAGRVDLVLVVDTYHHIDDRPGYFGRLRETLTKRGRLVIVDFEKRETPVGPPLEHKLAKEFVVEELAEAGYRLAQDLDELLPYQYALVFEPGRAGSR